MNFYIAQDKARRKTKWLVLFYLLALLLLTFVSTIVLMLLMPLFGFQSLPDFSIGFWSSLFSQRHLNTFLGVGAFIIGGALISSYIESRHLAKGGGVVAAGLGGVKISANTSNFNERKALNVVTEMAIASGMPVPDVYLLKHETGINAFAAGLMPSDAVIGLTQGAIDKLTRAQLQGVVGHEFSHILNGDMRLNLRIIMLLHGVAFIGVLGRILSSNSSRHRSGYNRSSRSKGKGNGNGGIIVVGLLLRLLGWLGVLFGHVVKAAVSRQREFLADASSVQFTRNPSAIGDALKVIGSPSQSTRIQKADISEVSHLFFGQAFRSRFNFILATHPQIEQRIQRVEPHWDGRFLKPLPVPVAVPEYESKTEPMKMSESLAMLMAAGIAIEHLNETAQKALESLMDHIKEPLDAMALVIVVLMSEATIELPEVKAENSAGLPQSVADMLFASCGDVGGLAQAVKQQQERLQSIDLDNRLPLIEIAMPALKEMSLQQYKQFQSCLLAVMDLDQKHTIYEQSVYQLISRYLDVHFELAAPIKVRYKKAKQVSIEIQLVMSLLAYYGHDSNSPGLIKQAFAKGMQVIDLQDVALLEGSQSNQALFQTATQKLAYCSDELKATILNGFMVCVEHDGNVADIERELVLAIAATLEVPISRVLLSVI